VTGRGIINKKKVKQRSNLKKKKDKEEKNTGGICHKTCNNTMTLSTAVTLANVASQPNSQLGIKPPQESEKQSLLRHNTTEERGTEPANII